MSNEILQLYRGIPKTSLTADFLMNLLFLLEAQKV